MGLVVWSGYNLLIRRRIGKFFVVLTNLESPVYLDFSVSQDSGISVVLKKLAIIRGDRRAPNRGLQKPFERVSKQMPIALSGSTIRWLTSDQALHQHHLNLVDLPKGVNAHLAQCPTTLQLESDGEAIRLRSPQANPAQFVFDVCRWGNWAGIGARVFTHNTVQHVDIQLQAACTELATTVNQSSLIAAIRQVNKINQLGSPSFASKHLRMLRPDACAVLDSIVATKCGYPQSAEGFADYSTTCSQIAVAAQEAGISNPMGAVWRVGDVEMSIFAHLRGWSGLRI